MILGIGLDLVEVERMRGLLARKGERALTRLFTDGERAYAAAHGEPARQLAARAAAKEAAYKALSGNDLARAIGWRELEVVSAAGRAPTLRLHGHAAARAAELGVVRMHLTITHSETTAAAFVVAEG
ncbi:MAG: holo-(acyl-carrier-protein) synthase [Gemmatimonadetes bacterium]|jgi:holo-[acyl-carrier protein] synthase|nr:holo-(acyl-carrier-protein) synthase [Gemmatimonadota bacterium]